MIDRYNFHLEIISLFAHLFSLIVNSQTIKVFDHFNVVNMERPAGLLPKEPLCIGISVANHICQRKLKTKLCKDYPVYRIVPSVHPVPG